ncbi:MAG: pcp 3, partial [Phycisphaerales bacterium]|nr:pcp 3 [Phycisphaerales bacterium]
MLAFSHGRTITPGIQYRPATDAHPTGRHAVNKRHVAHTQFVQLLPKGQATPTGAGSATPVGLTASQVRQAYGVNTLTFGGITGDGSGQTIAIIDAFDHPGFVDSTNADFVNSDLHKFDVAMGLQDPPSFKKIDERGGTNYPAANAGWAGEIALDVEWAHAMAPKANIVLIVADSANTNDLIEIGADTARNLPGVTAVSMSFAVDGGFAGEDYYDQFFTTPVGHAGVTFLAATGDNGAVLPAGGTTKQAAYPSESPNVVAVGGTTLQQNNGAYVSESGWSGSGGGISNYIAKPAYQSSVSQSSTQRTAPDISILADPNTGVAVYDSYNNTNGWFAGYFGGTSLSSPLWAGLVALTNQGRALNGVGSLTGIDQTLPRLYGLPASNLHDITTGNNGYAAGAGYDLVTGRGTPIVTTLLPNLAGGTYSGYTFVDRDNSKTYDAGIDTPLPGVTVYDDLNNNSAMQATEPSVLSDANGHFTLDLPGGQTYTIRTVRPTNYALTTLAGYSSQTAYGAFDIGSFGFFPTTIGLPSGQPNAVTLRLDASGNTLQVFQNVPTTGTPTYAVDKTTLANYTITINGGDGDDTLNVDLKYGNPLVSAASFVFNGGTQTSTDAAIVIAAAGGSAATFTNPGITVSSKTLTLSGVEAKRFTGGAGNDTLTLSSLSTNVSPAFTGGGGADTISVSGGTYQPNADVGADGTAVTLTTGAAK